MANRTMKCVRTPGNGLTILPVSFTYDADTNTITDVTGLMSVSVDSGTFTVTSDEYHEIVAVIPFVNAPKYVHLKTTIRNISANGAVVRLDEMSIGESEGDPVIVEEAYEGSFDAHVLVIAKNTKVRP